MQSEQRLENWQTVVGQVKTKIGIGMGIDSWTVELTLSPLWAHFSAHLTNIAIVNLFDLTAFFSLFYLLLKCLLFLFFFFLHLFQATSRAFEIEVGQLLSSLTDSINQTVSQSSNQLFIVYMDRFWLLPATCLSVWLKCNIFTMSWPAVFSQKMKLSLYLQFGEVKQK